MGSLNEGMIRLGEAPASWGFTRDRFTSESYLWKDGSMIIASFIEARTPGQGHFGALVRAIEADGFSVGVPTPLGKMLEILKRWGFESKNKIDKEYRVEYEIWLRPTKAR